MLIISLVYFDVSVDFDCINIVFYFGFEDWY